MKASPPMTPPAMAPTGVECFGAAPPPIWLFGTQTVEAQESQVVAVSWQVSLGPQAGQEGVSGGHCKHRRNSRRS